MAQVGSYDLRAENVNRAVIGFAKNKYKFKQICLIQTSSSWKETFWKESKAALSGSGTREGKIEGVPRFAAFPYVEPTWTEVNARHKKHAGTSKISIEDNMTDEIDVQARTFERVAEAVVNSVDLAIYSAITSDSDVNTAAALANWDDATEANRKPIDDILIGIRDISIDNYDVLENGYLLLSPKDYTNLLRNSKVINNPSFKSADVVTNGVVAQICGLKIIVSNNVDPDEACILKGQTAVTWKAALGLTSEVIRDPGIKFTIRAWEMGVAVVTNPEAIHIITNTQA